MFHWASSGWCRSKAGRSERILGSEVKLCRGGGQEVAHSSEAPKPHGSSTSTRFLERQVIYTFQKKGISEAPRTKEEIVENWFIHVNPSSWR